MFAILIALACPFKRVKNYALAILVIKLFVTNALFLYPLKIGILGRILSSSEVDKMRTRIFWELSGKK